ncbi:hypothetical protein [Glycomyces sp. NPDC047010]|uniref:hypothetical protein n=1 Tax=Glycomyces sp. NPDC047010 TaxID=3155023 RepID=UPI0033D5BE47
MFTPIEFVRQRAAMIDQLGRADPTLIFHNTSFLSDVTGLDVDDLDSDGRWLCEEQRNALIAADMYLFTPELAECARQAMAQLGPGEHLDLDPLPPGAVFAFTEPVRHPGGTGGRLCSVMLPMTRLAFANKDNPEAPPLQTSLLSYTLRSDLLAHVRDRIAAGVEVDHNRKAEAALLERSTPWRLIGLEVAHHAKEFATWGMLLRCAVTFARSPGIAQTVRAPIPRGVARAAARAAAPVPDTGIRVVDLRSRPATVPREESEESGRTLQHRVIVRGHWRHQACGPNRSERRLVWIDQHLRGPERAPIQGTERVYFGRPPH